MRPKRTKRTKPKTTRNTKDKAIARTTDPRTKRCLAMYGQPHAPTREQIIVGTFNLIREIRDNPKPGVEMLQTPGDRLLEAEAKAGRFIADAMLSDYSSGLKMLEGLLEAFKNAKTVVGVDLDKRRRALLACNVPVRRAAKIIISEIGSGDEENERRQRGDCKTDLHAIDVRLDCSHRRNAQESCWRLTPVDLCQRHRSRQEQLRHRSRHRSTLLHQDERSVHQPSGF